MKKTLLAIDYRLQMILLLFIGGTCFMIFPLLLLVPLGIYQVWSAAVKGFTLDSYRHRVFALVAGTYGTAIMLLAFYNDVEPIKGILDLVPHGWEQGYAVVLYVLLPMVSAIYYANQSYKDYHAAVDADLELQKVKEFV